MKLMKPIRIIRITKIKKANEDNKDNEDKKANKDNEDKKDVYDGWWKPSNNNKKRVMLCGTYPIGTSNGYSKVVYYISKYLGIYEDIELTIYGFQNVSKYKWQEYTQRYSKKCNII